MVSENDLNVVSTSPNLLLKFFSSCFRHPLSSSTISESFEFSFLSSSRLLQILDRVSSCFILFSFRLSMSLFSIESVGTV